MGLQRKLAGAGVGSLKYDLLTAIGLIGLHGTASQQVSMARLSVLVTARYNWARDEISIGQRDMARIWAVNERTAKREVKRLTDMQILGCLRPGVRGRVAAYRLDIGEICTRSRPSWASVGPDFVERMEGFAPSAPTLSFTPPAPPDAVSVPENVPGRWGRVLSHLDTQDRATFETWFSKLELVSDQTPEVHVKASSAFVGRYIETHLGKVLMPVFAAVYGPTARLRISA
ncbi:hypothetical protein [Oceaniglobus trochenteri]|uniref:hypothetical protein n=1 Tax=Oceaniglobus trochenteri TaxID=2763260 RepID=UPI001CFFA306|nr:hypothetical protein [Oceaniglobus trochenteri]